MGKKKAASTETEIEGTGKPKATWPEDIVAIFCDIAVKEVIKGNRPGTHFDKKGWENVVKAFNESTGRDYTKGQLKNKWDSLKNDWKLWSSLMHKETGIGWDPVKKTIDAPAEWWQNKIKSNPEYRKFRDGGISPEMMDIYDQMFKGSTALGESVMIPSASIAVEEVLVEDSEHDGDNDEDPEPEQGIQDRGKKRTIVERQTEGKKDKGVLRGAKGKKGREGGAAKLSKQIDRLVELVEIICVAARLMQVYLEKYILKTPCMTSSQTGYIWLMEVLRGNKTRCYNAFRMEKNCFYMLLKDIEKVLGGSKNICTAEILAMFLYILGGGETNRDTQERFQRSGETVSRYFSQMLDILYKMAGVLIKPLDPEFRSTPKEIENDSRYMPHFKDCVGAIDGVHVQASISPCDQVPYIGRKGTPTQNVMAVCDFDMTFTFVCAGWEGTAHDSRVFLSAIRDPLSNFPKPPNGKYYLVDAGYPQMRGYLGPYKGERYHLPHFRRGDEPTGQREVFNHAHSSLRGVIERTFGVWKKKWSILRDMPSFPYEKQVKIVIATMALHNYIRRYAHEDRDFDESDDFQSEEIGEDVDDNEHEEDGMGRQEMEVLRNTIAQSLMNESI